MPVGRPSGGDVSSAAVHLAQASWPGGRRASTIPITGIVGAPPTRRLVRGIFPVVRNDDRDTAQRAINTPDERVNWDERELDQPLSPNDPSAGQVGARALIRNLCACFS